MVIWPMPPAPYGPDQALRFLSGSHGRLAEGDGCRERARRRSHCPRGLELYRLPARPAARFRREKPQEFRRSKAIGRSGFYAKLEIMDRIARGLPEAAVDRHLVETKVFE